MIPKVYFHEDIEPYKKIFLAQGFYELALEKKVILEFQDRKFFEKRFNLPLDPYPIYRMDKNINYLVIQTGLDCIKIAYDTNDYYYKIPNLILNWADVYFKSNYQEDYLRTGQVLKQNEWKDVKIDEAALPEPLELSLTKKIMPCSFTMELFDSFKKNKKYLKSLRGAWLSKKPERKKNDLFYQGRYWDVEYGRTHYLFDAIKMLNLKLAGGLVQGSKVIPDHLKKYETKPVDLKKWNLLASNSKVSLMTRGLHGCLSFKPLNFLLIGAPFIANKILAQTWSPIVQYKNYFVVENDFSNLESIFKNISSDQLWEMGQNNLKLWDTAISPAAMATHVLGCLKV